MCCDGEGRIDGGTALLIRDRRATELARPTPLL
jgi:hypothetical protein